MYLNYYNLRTEPFSICPNPEFLYLSPTHREALASVIHGIRARKGFLSLVGEVGTGKTTILSYLLRQRDPEKLKKVYLFNPEISFAEVVREVFLQLGLTGDGENLDMNIRILSTQLINYYRENVRVVLFIDEAQRMPVETLERLRLLSNLETTKHKLLQIVLCGQPELDEVLSRNELRQLRQRITVRASLKPLSYRESLACLKHRLERASLDNESVFEERALRKIARYSLGNPRVMNILAENALVTGFACQLKPIPPKVIREVIADYEGKRTRRVRWAFAAAATVMVLSVLAVLTILSTREKPLSWHGFQPVSAAPLGTVPAHEDGVETAASGLTEGETFR